MGTATSGAQVAREQASDGVAGVQPAGRTSEVAGTLGASVSELGAMRLAGAKRGKGVPRRSGGVSGAERGRPVAEQVRACGHLPYLRVGNVFGRV